MGSILIHFSRRFFMNDNQKNSRTHNRGLAKNGKKCNKNCVLHNITYKYLYITND